MDISKLIQSQRVFFNSDVTKDVRFRKDALNRLYEAIVINEENILKALKEDLNKSSFEGYMSEIGIVRDEIRHFIKHLSKWSKPKRVTTPLAQFPSKSYIMSEPYGVVLIMAPWNYPFQLCIEPLIGAIGAGNCAVIKPSAYAPATSKIIAQIIEKIFPSDYVAVVQGGRKENSELLENRFDYIFFTGSTNVGKTVMEAASKHLTPISLELGGKSPAIVDKSADIPLFAKRIAFGKYLNAGQTCVAPDYVLVHESIKNEFVEALKISIKDFFGDNPMLNDNLPKIINEKHFLRLLDLMKDEKIVIGGRNDKTRLFIEPTVVTDITYDSAIMQEEIFGPILPILTYTDINDVISDLKTREKPLALYVFSTNSYIQRKITENLSYGGGCINDTIVHLATSKMGFGGVGYSGMGAYHGKFSFDTFTHYKGILNKAIWLDLPMRYHPYNEKNYKMIKMFLK
ncbi:MAG TPA: aldehyde dehydrogenase [Clostridia bacterium]|nr:aldehyde dehydrogenase [Clostridia bacterium]